MGQSTQQPEVKPRQNSAAQIGIILGTVFLIMGVGTGAIPIAILGLIFLAIGIQARRKRAA